MKIDQVKPQTPASLRRARSTNAGQGTAFQPAVSESSEDQAAAPSVVQNASLDMLLTLQEVAQPVNDDERARRRGEELLGHLEEIRYGLLEGRLSQHELRRLSHLLSAQRPPTHDPHLQAVLDEIEVRAAVELAKFERA